MTGIRHDLSQYYSIKDLFELVLGKASFKKLKDAGSIKDWKLESVRLLKAISLSVEATVEIVDQEWIDEFHDLINKGASSVESSSEIDELFASLAATLGQLVFLQIGFLPHAHRTMERVPLTVSHWKLNLIRSVQYVQSEDQRRTQFRITKRKNIGQ